jgi:glycosyltransferase involved in cell wall biosynthesis
VNKPLRILGVLDLPWDPRLGAARVWIELGEQWKKAGHTFEKFCLTDAFPEPTGLRPLSALRRVLFPDRAARYVRQNASRVDVIDSLIGTLPFSKRQLSFNGLHVGRSVGLYRPYQDFLQFSRQKWPDQPRGKLIGRLFYDFMTRCHGRNSERALRHCDLINLLNDEEKSFVRDKQVVVQPNGLSDAERAAFAAAMQLPGVRLEQKQICFIGMWSLRKGSRDWSEIIRRIRGSIPNAQFTFLGTMVDEANVLADLCLSRADGVRCITTYYPEELPVLLGPCAIGLFPSYVEGFGIAVLEQLACGIPTIAYDVPGPRQILSARHAELLVPPGDVGAMADRALNILRMDEQAYGDISAECLKIASQFRWEQIAAETVREYAEALELLRGQTSRREPKVAGV